MPTRKASETLYMNADRTKLVKEGDPDAAFLFVRKGSAINDAEAERYGFTVKGSNVEDYDAVADHAEKHEGETAAESRIKRANMFKGEDDPDGPAAAGERGNLREAAKDPALDGPAQGDVANPAVEPVTGVVEPDQDAKAATKPPSTKAVKQAPENK